MHASERGLGSALARLARLDCAEGTEFGAHSAEALQARHREERIQMMLARLAELAQGAQRLDAGSALKFCDVASGSADVYPRTSPCYEWDLAAGDALVRAAGGSVTTLEGARVCYNQWDSLKAPKFVAAGDSDINYLELIPDPDL